MRKYILLLFTPLLLSVNAFAYEEYHSADEVILETESIHNELKILGVETSAENPVIEQEVSLKDKLRNVYNINVTDYSTNNYLLTDIVTKHFDSGIIESIHPFAGFNGSTILNFNKPNSFKANYGFNAVNAGFDGKFRDGYSDFRILFMNSPLSGRNLLRNSFSDVYIGTNRIKNHRLQLGYQRPAVGIEGKISAFQLPFTYRSQISRTFGTVRKNGVRIIGDYNILDYDLGLYSSSTYLKSFFSGAEFDGWINVNPLAKTDGKFGNIKLGGGIQHGKRNSDYTVTGLYAEYKYKKFMANIEWANASGYNGFSGDVSTKHASGFYTTASYMLTPKAQLLARYDEFNPEHNVKNDNKREYSLGLNYFVKGPGLKLFFNYVFCQNASAKDSHRIILGTQILL